MALERFPSKTKSAETIRWKAKKLVEIVYDINDKSKNKEFAKQLKWWRPMEAALIVAIGHIWNLEDIDRIQNFCNLAGEGDFALAKLIPTMQSQLGKKY